MLMDSFFINLRRLGWAVAALISLAAGGLVGVQAQNLRINDLVVTNGTVLVNYASDTNRYYLLTRADRLEQAFQPQDAALGLAGVGVLRDRVPLPQRAFYRIISLPVSAPIDSDHDGIDDVYELRTAGLSPLISTDAALPDPNGGGRTYLQRYQQLQSSGIRITKTSPINGEGDVAVTRETILYFDQPLASNAVVGTDRLFATFGGRKILSRADLSSDRRKVTLFYLEDLPAGARIRVTLATTGLKNEEGVDVDGDGDGRPGGDATVDFDTLNIAPIGKTAVVGRVFASEVVPDTGSGTNRPLKGVTITVDGAEEILRAVTDDDGNFVLQPAPAGRFFVHIDGRTAVGSDWPAHAYYPVVGKAWEAVAGRTNNLAGETGQIFLPFIREGTLKPVSINEDTKVTFPAEVIAANPLLNGVEITVPANSLFSDNGNRGGRVGIAPVPPDRLPGPLPPGLAFALVITIQTDGAQNFDRPVPVRFPNLPNPLTGVKKSPGEKSALWSFSHDTGEWEVIGPMTVSADGKFVITDPGVGVLQPGWHGEDPACRGKGDTGLGNKYNSLPPGTADITGGMMQAGAGAFSVLLDVGSMLLSESPLGKGAAIFNVVLDLGDLYNEPSGANLFKVVTGVAAAIPGAGLIVKVPALLTDIKSTADDLGKVVNTLQNANADCNPGGPTGLSERGRAHPAAQAGVAIAPPPEYFSRNYYRGPEQTAALEAARAHIAEFNARLTAQAPLHLDYFTLFERFDEESRRILAKGVNNVSAAETQAYIGLGVNWTNALFRVTGLPSLADPLIAAFREIGRFQNYFDINTALLAIPSARGHGAPLKVLTDAYLAKHPLQGQGYYRITSPGIVQRGKFSPEKPLVLNLRPNTPYLVDLFDPDSRSVARRPIVSSAAGTEFELGYYLLQPVDISPDTDSDGLSDFAEGVIGTSIVKADSDGDGVTDLAELQAGTNPLDNAPAEVGVIAAVSFNPPGGGPATAADVCALENRAIVALEAAGIAVLDVSRPSNPTVIARVDTPGTARRVACDGDLVAVADDGAGLVIVDISDPPAARIAVRVPEVGQALSVTAANTIAYVGTAAGDVVRVHLASGTILGKTRLGGPVNDVAIAAGRLFAIAGRRLHVIGIRPGGGLDPLFSSDSPEQGDNPLRLFVGDTMAYVVHHTGYNLFNISQKDSAPTLLATGVTAQRGWKQLVDNGAGLGVATVSANLSFDGRHYVGLYDLSNPRTNNVSLAILDTPGIARSVTLHRGLAFVAAHTDGFLVVNYLAADLGSTPPSISLDASFPLDPPRAEEGSFATLIAHTSDDVQVRDVEFYLNGLKVYTDGNYPFELPFFVPRLTAGATQFKLRALATDTGGNRTWSPEMTVQILRDQTGPRAFASEPTASGYGVSLTAVDALFDESMAPASFAPDSMKVVYLGPDRRFGTADDQAIAGTLEYVDGARLIRFHAANTLPMGRIRVELDTTPTDLTGNHLEKPLVWAFEHILGQDSDHDGLTDDFELAFGLDPNNGDQNNNGILDSAEDFDGDGLVNGVEMLIGTNQRNPRTFNGQLDGERDQDGDYLPDYLELSIGTDPRNPDTDGDGWNDEIEVHNGSDPLQPNRFLPGLYGGLQHADALLLAGVLPAAEQSYALRADDGTPVLAAKSDVLLQSGPNDLGYTVNLATPVRLRELDPQSETLSPYELPRAGAFLIEAEDYNHDAGQHVPASDVMPYTGGAYAGLGAVFDVDYHNGDNAPSQVYRLATGKNIVIYENLAGQYGLQRAGWNVTSNFRIANAASGDWQQYTRTVPAGTYYVWGAFSYPGDSADQIKASLDLVTGNPTQPNASVTPLGTFRAPGTGAFGNNNLVLLRDAVGNPAVVNLSGATATFRVNLNSGEFDWLIFIRTDAGP